MCWQNDEVVLHLLDENLALDLRPGDCGRAWVAIVATAPGVSVNAPDRLAAWAEVAAAAWRTRLDRYLRNVPVVTSDIPGLDAYDNRALASGLVCIWENPAFLLNPHVATSGIDGGSICSYLWDIGGYAAHMITLMLGEDILPIARQFQSIDLEQSYAFTLDGKGIGVRYAYSPWSFAKLVEAITAHLDLPADLDDGLKNLLLTEEANADATTLLIDDGGQENLLEMRGVGYEHVVASPNAERAWSLRHLADLADLAQDADAPTAAWRTRADQIIESVRTTLWDDERGWFKALYPDGYEELVYSVQIFDALRAGACTPAMTDELLTHLHDGAFLGAYGVHSVSQADSRHFELNDPDWSGGGAFSGEGPQLALTLFEQGFPELAVDVLQRHFWLGQHLPYIPQEHYADRPMAAPISAPIHRRPGRR